MRQEIIYFLLNGGVATAVHFIMLVMAVEVINIHNLIVSNILAGLAGVSSSFLGNKYFVFKCYVGRIHYQALRFILFYACILIAHTFFISYFSDYIGVDYRASFVIASSIMLAISFLSNKYLVFMR